MTLSSAQDNNNIKETQRRLALAQEALYGFATSAGRLPCPADASGGGVEAPNDGTGVCTSALNGFLPGNTLGLSPTDEQGYFLDAWGNRIRYAVYNKAIAGPIGSVGNPFTINNGMRDTKLENFGGKNFLHVCENSPVGAKPQAPCGSVTELTNKAIAVIFSTGRDATGDPENTNGDFVFISRNSSDFDDIVVWLSPNILFNRMIAAGRLP